MKSDADGSFSDGFSTNVFPQAMRRRPHPHGHHRREVERRDAGDDAERLADRVDVDAGRGLLGELALEQRRDAARVLDHLEAARDLADRVGEHLAVLGGEDARDVLAVLVERARGSRRRARRASTSDSARQAGNACFARPGRRGRPPRRWRSRPRRSARRSPGCRPGRCGPTRRRRTGRRSSG